MLNIQQVLDITELSLHIIQFLDRDDYFTCALVNKAWHHDFQPLVWETFRIGYSDDEYDHYQHNIPAVTSTLKEEQKTEQLTSLRKHAHLIRHLHLHWSLKQPRCGSIMEVLHQRCRQLVSFETTISHFNPDDWILCVELATRNPGLQRAGFYEDWPLFKAGVAQSKRSFFCAWRRAEMPSLRRLAIGCSMSLFTLAWVVKTCPALEDLVMKASIVPHTDDDYEQDVDSDDDFEQDVDSDDDFEQDVDSDDDYDHDDSDDGSLQEAFESFFASEWLWDFHQPFGLKGLEFGEGCYCKGLDKFLMLCPLLEALVLNGISDDVCEEFCRVLRDGYLPNLTSFMEVSRLEYGRLLLDVLEAVPMHQLQRVEIWDATTSDIEKLVERQHRSLKDMHISFLPLSDEKYVEQEEEEDFVDTFDDTNRAYNRGSVVCSILASCSQLRTLKVESGLAEVYDTRQVIAQPWVCKALRILEIPVELARNCSDLRLLQHAEAEKRQAARQGKLPKQLPSLPHPDETQYDAPLSQAADELEEWEQCEVVWMKYLGQLNQLRVLDLSLSIFPINQEHAESESLTWTLSLGLGYLQNLTLMEHLILPVHPFLQDEREWMFMKQYWPRFRVLETMSYFPKTYLNRIHDFWPELIVRKGARRKGIIGESTQTFYCTT